MTNLGLSIKAVISHFSVNPESDYERTAFLDCYYEREDERSWMGIYVRKDFKGRYRRIDHDKLFSFHSGSVFPSEGFLIEEIFIY